MMASDLRAPRLGLWLLLLGCLFVFAPTTYPGYWQSQEGFVPVFNAPHSGNVASVATTPDLWRGMGRGTFLLAQSAMALGASPVLAVRISFAIALLLGGLGVYVWLRPRLGDRAAGLAGLIYLFMPPILATVYVRGSLADALMVGLLPLALAGLASYAEGRSLTAAAVVVLSLLWMWRIQSGLAIFATLLLIAYAAVVERSRMGVLVAAVSGAAGLASLLPLWGITSPSPVVFSDHFVNLTQLLASGWQVEAISTTTPVGASFTLWQNQAYHVGFAAVTLSVLGLWLWTRRVGGQRSGAVGRLLRFSWIGIAVILLLTLTVAAPLWSLMRAERLLTYPWQLLLIASPLFAVAAGSLPAINKNLDRAPLWLALVGVVLLSSLPYLHADYTQVEPPLSPVATFGRQPELVLLAAELSEEVQEDAATGVMTPTATLDVTWQVLQPIPFDYNVFFQAVADEGDEWQVMAQLDTQPRQGLEPATTWQVGQIMTDTYQLVLPTGMLPGMSGEMLEGELRYYYGYYDWRDGTRLPIDGGIDDKLILHGE
jgi:hypothetical protein